jgi:hypothetical protein
VAIFVEINEYFMAARKICVFELINIVSLTKLFDKGYILIKVWCLEKQFSIAVQELSM